MRTGREAYFAPFFEMLNGNYNRRSRHWLMVRHVFVSVVFIFLYLLLSHPQVIFFSSIGFVAWYPATGLVIAMLFGVSPWYALIAGVSDVLASNIFYHQPLASYGSTLGAIGIAGCYGLAAGALRGSLHVDLK